MSLGPYEVLDERFRACFNRTAQLERLWTGARWTEGPAYLPAARSLVFSDIPNDRMLRFDECDGHVSVFRQPCASSTTAAGRSSPTASTASASTRRTTWW